MPEYIAPGVFVEEIWPGPTPIDGVATSTVGAGGVTERGPADGKPALVTRFADFERVFGAVLPEPPAEVTNRWASDAEEGGRWWTFPLSVKGFFDNGGKRLFVRRVTTNSPEALRVEDFAEAV